MDPPMQLNDDVLLCIMCSTDIDTFLGLRMLSKAVSDLIEQNLHRICEKVAQNTFPGHPYMLRCALTSSDHDIIWLKQLRLRQLTVIVVECTSFNYDGDRVMCAQDADHYADRAREKIMKGWELFNKLSRITRDVAAWPQSMLPVKTDFALPAHDLDEGRRRLRNSRSTIDYLTRLTDQQDPQTYFLLRSTVTPTRNHFL